MKVTSLHGVEPFITIDGSEIREVAGIPTGNAVNQSLAEATVAPGTATEEHYHAARRRSTSSLTAAAGCAWATRSARSSRATRS